MEKETEEREQLITLWEAYSSQTCAWGDRRITANAIYVAAFAAAFAGLITHLGVIGLIGSIFCLLMSIVWLIMLFAWRQLTKTKFEIIEDLEKKISLFQPYNQEWANQKKHRYVSITLIELAGVVLFIFGFAALLVLSACVVGGTLSF